MSQPISPADVGLAKANLLPAFVFDAFNELIARHCSNGRARIYQHDVVDLIYAKANKGLSSDDIDDGAGVSRDYIRANYLNVEEAYRAKGWTVTYDRPGFNESYSAHYIFEM